VQAGAFSTFYLHDTGVRAKVSVKACTFSGTRARTPVSIALEARMFNFIRSLDRKSTFAVGFVTAFLLFAAIILLQLSNRDQEIAKQKGTGLGAVNAGVDWSDPYSQWHSGPHLLDAVLPSTTMHKGAAAAYLMMAPENAPAAPQKIVRTGRLSLSVSDPLRAINDISGIAQEYGGYLVTEQNQMRAVTGEEGQLTLRVPSEKFDEARSRIKALAVRVDEEQATANDVTKDYFDFDARLHSLHAEEEQYLQILKSAHKVEDVLSVTEKLDEVRSQIERAQGEFNYLQKTVETSLIEVHLQTAPGGRFAGLDWHPLMRVKLELRDGVEALGEFAGALLSILVRLPAILLWLFTIATLGALAWRIARRIWRWFVPAVSPVAQL